MIDLNHGSTKFLFCLYYRSLLAVRRLILSTFFFLFFQIQSFRDPFFICPWQDVSQTIESCFAIFEYLSQDFNTTSFIFFLWEFQSIYVDFPRLWYLVFVFRRDIYLCPHRYLVRFYLLLPQKTILLVVHSCFDCLAAR